MTTELGGAAALWSAVIAIGAWHGLNPSMGWPLAVAAGLSERRDGAVFATLAPLGAGHFLAMATVLVPFAAAGAAFAWSRPLRLGAGLLVLAFGVYRLFERRHPRWLARVRPTQLALWSFLMATAHGAGLMLLPFALGLCAPSAGWPAGGGNALAGAIAVAAAHTLAMLLAGIAVAWAVYRYVGLGLLTRGWLDLDAAWAASLVIAGTASVAMAW
jgi:hypothetical protein